MPPKTRKGPEKDLEAMEAQEESLTTATLEKILARNLQPMNQ